MSNDAPDSVSETPKGLARKPRLNLIFLALALLVAALNLPLLLNRVLPVHDTMFFFHCFYYYYNELFVNGEIARWVPYGYWGVQSDFFFLALSPARMFVALLGDVFRVSNAYLLFKTSILLEQLVYLYGVYKLASLVFKRKATVVFVCLASICGTALLVQITFNFTAYYLLPLIIYFLMRFFATYKPQYAFGAMLAGIASLVGEAPYIAMIILFEMAIICPILFIGNLGALKKVRVPSGRDLLISVAALLMLLSLTASFGYFVKHTLDEAIVLSGGRDPLTGATDLQTFLTYGGDVNWIKFKGLWSPEYRTQLGGITATAYDSSIYFGFIPFALFLYSLLSFRNFKNPLYLSVLLTAIATSLLSVGYLTPFATWLYKGFPLMKFYRHVGYVSAALKFFIPLLAGFGFEHLITKRESEGGIRRLIWELAAVAAFALSVLFLSRALSLVTPEAAVRHTIKIYFAMAASLVLAMAFVRLIFNMRSHLAVLIIVLCLFEIFSYQYIVQNRFSYLGQNMKPLRTEVFYTHDYRFQAQRTMKFPNERAMEAFPLVLGTTPYAFGYDFMQWDPCMPKIRADHLNNNVTALITLWGDPPNYMQLDLPARPKLYSAMGCTDSKLRLLSNVSIAKDASEAGRLLKAAADNSAVVLSDVSDKDRTDWEKASGTQPAQGAIVVKDFRANGLDLEVDAISGPLWLYYADAWHSGWRATVNGKPADIAKANLAFKAVLVPEGKNNVSFFFAKGGSYPARLVIIIVGILVMVYFVGSMIRALLFPAASEKNGTDRSA